jgi:hypothetical protein
MPIKNIIEKAEKQFPVDQNITDAIKQAVSNISGGNGGYPLDNPSGFITTGDLVGLELRIAGDIVYTTGNQTISGLKTFTNATFNTRPTVNGTGVLLSGEAAKLPDTLVYTTGGQTISGSLSFESDNYFFDGANVYFVNNTGIVSGEWRFTNRPTVNGTGIILSGEGIVANQISDSTAAGRTLLTSNLANQRTHLAFFPSFSGRSSFPVNGDVNRVYTALDTSKIYAWISLLNDYVEISPTPTGELDNRYTQNLGNVSGIRAMTTGEYNSLTPISGVLYILI